MPVWFQSLVVLVIIWTVARAIKRHTPLLQRYFIPSSLVGGVLLLLISYQVVGIVPQQMTHWLSLLPATLINVVFATMFLGQRPPRPATVWRQAGPMIAFGNTIAWGMYVLGGILTLLVFVPFFDSPPLFGALLEISFSGGHGTAAGLAPTFEKLGYPEATNIALGLATLSIVIAVVSGITIINLYNKKVGRTIDKRGMSVQQKRMIRNGYNLTHISQGIEAKPHIMIIALTAIACSIGIGWLMLQGLIALENIVLAGKTSIRVFANLPLFPLAMFGGLITQFLIERLHLTNHVDVPTTRTFSNIALDLLIITAIGTMSITAIEHNFMPFVILSIAGCVWIIAAFLLLAPRFFHKYWFEYGMTDMGQAMGMTATGLLMNRLVDPLNRTGARQSFAYKQIAYEPFMGGGIVTSFAAIATVEFGLLPVIIIASIITLFWLILGLRLGTTRRRRSHRAVNLAKFAMRD